jgi:hypothetical protein
MKGPIMHFLSPVLLFLSSALAKMPPKLHFITHAKAVFILQFNSPSMIPMQNRQHSSSCVYINIYIYIIVCARACKEDNVVHLSEWVLGSLNAHLGICFSKMHGFLKGWIQIFCSDINSASVCDLFKWSNRLFSCLTLCHSYLKPYCMGRKTVFFSGHLIYILKRAF